MPDCAGFLFGFKARQQAHSELCNCWGNAEAEQKDQQDGIFFDRNRLKSAPLNADLTKGRTRPQSRPSVGLWRAEKGERVPPGAQGRHAGHV